MIKVYLGGPIRGLTYDVGVGWRDLVTEMLAPEITAFSPLRGKAEILANVPVMDSSVHPVDHVLTSPKGIVSRDHYDVVSCDLIFVNFLGTDRVSIGTISEIAWGYQIGKPIVVAMEDNNVHRHPFVTEQAGFIVGTLEEAVHITRSILLPFAGQ